MVTAAPPPKCGETWQAPPSAPGLKRKSKHPDSHAAQAAEASLAQANEQARVNAADKRLATLKAQAALLGWTVFVVDVGPTLLVTRWGRSTEMGLAEAEAFVRANKVASHEPG